MPRKNSYLTASDFFCGAGGFSIAFRKASNRQGELKLALNHWKRAIETHSTNFPDAIHECTDISACDPRRYPSTDILLASPECTNHTLAKGKKQIAHTISLFEKGLLDPSAERSRATMWDVPRFAEYHDYRAVIVENVIDAWKWRLFPAWLHAMRNLGYLHRICFFNSQFFFPTPQSRDRMYVVFWKKGVPEPKLDYKPLAYCERCAVDVRAIQTFKTGVRYGKYKQQYTYNCPSCGTVAVPYYYPAASIIDWTNLGTRISDRAKTLSPNTIKRIKYGLEKYGKTPFQVINYTPGYCRPVTNPTGTITTDDHHALCTPEAFVVNDQHSTGTGFRVRGISETISAVTTQPHLKLVTPPFVFTTEHSSNEGSGYVRSVDQPLNTQTTRHTHGVVIPMIGENYSNGRIRDIHEPVGTITTSGAHHSLLSYFYGGSIQASSTGEVVRTVTTNDRAMLVTPGDMKVEDCHYRMLTPEEIGRAMAFPDDYKVLGTKKERLRQYGNAVTPPAAEFLNRAVMNALK